MTPELFRKIVIMFTFNRRADFVGPVHEAFWDWLSDAAGQIRLNPEDYECEDVETTPQYKEITIRVDGEDAHDGKKRKGMIYSNFDGEVREVEYW